VEPLQDQNTAGGGNPETLGGVLYADGLASTESEAAWVNLVTAVAAGDQHALHALYERTSRLVFALAMQITRSRETSEEVTLDVFYGVWKRARNYSHANGTVLGWIMNQARSRAIDRVRFETRKKRAEPAANEVVAEVEEGEWADVLELKQQSDEVRAALTNLTPAEKQAIELAFFADLTHAEVAQKLRQPLGTVKTRIRSALHKLRQTLAEKVRTQ
jgi:RNA polymerase sigma-70 factor (ECF subfamily)